MITLGIDPGFGIIGYAALKKERDGTLAILDYGAINTPKDQPFVKRLKIIADCINELITRFNPDEIALEQLFFGKNITTGIPVAHARGVIMLECEKREKPIFEYNPQDVKQSLTGQFRADKAQMQQMVMRVLNLSKPPKPDDAADALAIAICHMQTNQLIAIRRLSF